MKYHKMLLLGYIDYYFLYDTLPKVILNELLVLVDVNVSHIALLVSFRLLVKVYCLLDSILFMRDFIKLNADNLSY